MTSTFRLELVNWPVSSTKKIDEHLFGEELLVAQCDQCGRSEDSDVY